MNGNFIFQEGLIKDDPNLEAALKDLPVVADPSLTLEGEKLRDKIGEGELKKRLYFEVIWSRGKEDGVQEYDIHPVSLHFGNRVASYVPSSQLSDWEAWKDQLVVQRGNYVFGLFFDPKS